MTELSPILDAYGRPIRREVLTQEIAGPTISGVRSPIAGYPGDGLNPSRLAAILREADQGEPLRYFELAEQIEERDLHYAGVLATRKRSVTQIDINVDAASEDRDDVARADMVREWLKRGELQDELFDVLDAIGKGMSFTEIMWDTSEGQWRPGRLEWRDPRWFRFDHVSGAKPLLRTETGDVPLPGFKFIQAVMRAKSGLPIRSGIARLATWFWMFKAYTLRDWAIFTQTFGQPIRVGKYPYGASEKDKDTLFSAVVNVAGDCAAIIPESMLIEFIESKNVGASHALFKERADWLDQQMSKAVLGQTATTDAIAGGHAVGQEHRQVQEVIERADCKVLSAVLNRDLIRPWMKLEFGDNLAAYPTLRIARPEQEDIKGLVDNIVKVVPLGAKVGKAWLNDKLGIPDPGENEELLAAPAAAPAFMPSFTPALNSSVARMTAANIAALVEQSEQLCGDGTDALIDEVRAVVLNATDFADLRAKLAKLKPAHAEMNLAGLLRMARVLANLQGRADIADA